MRKGLGKGLGMGYKNIVPIDSHIHSLSAKGVKSQQCILMACSKKENKLKAMGHSKNFKIDDTYSVTAWWEKTSYGFRHIAVLYENGREVERGKATYYNRTWESYEFESVIYNVVSKHFPEKEVPKIMEKIKKNRGSMWAKGLDAKYSYQQTPLHRQSFYGKAIVEVDGSKKILYSYGTKVAEVDTETNDVKVFGTYSATTLRHIKAFLNDYGWKAESKAQIMKDYGVSSMDAKRKKKRNPFGNPEWDAERKAELKYLKDVYGYDDTGEYEGE